MKILFLSAAKSIHTVKWVNAFAARGHEVYLVYNKEAVSAAFKGSDIILWLAGHLRFNKVRGEDPYPSIINVSTLEQGSYNKIRLSDSDARFFIVTPEDGKETLWYGTEIRR